MQITLAKLPESNTQLLMRSLRLYYKSLGHVFMLALLFSIIIFIPRLLTLLIGQNIFTTYFSLQNMWLFFINICSIFVLTAILWRTRCIIKKEHESLFDDVKIAIQKLILIVAGAIIQTLIFIIFGLTVIVFSYYVVQKQLLSTWQLFDVMLASATFMLYFIAIIYIFFLFIFYFPLILTENKGVLVALKKSVLLVWGNWWRVFWVQTLPWIGYLIVLLIIRFILKIDIHIFYIGAMQNNSLGIVIFNIILFSLFVPWNAAVLLVQLRDLELRKRVNP